MISNKLLQKLQQKLSPQQIQLMKLLQLPNAALEQRIKEELEVNPTLEEDEEVSKDDVSEIEQDVNDSDNNEDDIDIYPDDNEIISFKNNDKDKPDRELTFISETSLHEDLISQLHLQNLTDKEMLIGLELIGNLDDAGYLSRSISSMVDDFAFRQNLEVSEEEIEKVLHVLQTFDPSGIGARDLQECLLIQLKRKEQVPEIILGQKIISKSFELFKKKQYNNIINKLSCSEEDLQKAVEEIVKLNPKPANSKYSNDDEKFTIIPDFLVWQQNGKVEFQLNRGNTYSLKTNRYYEGLLNELSESKSKKNKETITFLKDKLESAQTFIDLLNRRNDTLQDTMKAIINYQYDYFLDGDINKLKPMRLVDIAEKVNLDISTISRVVNSKYVQTHFGIFPLKDFFSNYMLNEEGEAVSTDAIKNQLVLIIEEEDKTNPLTDDQLVDMLKEKGFPIARRTVAKYRESLKIPVARLRKSVL